MKTRRVISDFALFTHNDVFHFKKNRKYLVSLPFLSIQSIQKADIIHNL
jgi:hypothetical protein